jgi:hypothetical protein
VWNTRACLDVSDQLESVRAETDALKRANLVRDKRQEIAKAAELELAPPGSAEAASTRCEVRRSTLPLCARERRTSGAIACRARRRGA